MPFSTSLGFPCSVLALPRVRRDAGVGVGEHGRGGEGLGHVVGDREELGGGIVRREVGEVGDVGRRDPERRDVGERRREEMCTGPFVAFVGVSPSTAERSGEGPIGAPLVAFTPVVTTMAYLVFGSSGYPSAGPTTSVSGSQ